MGLSVHKHVNTSDFFANLTKKAKVIADKESSKMAGSMVHILTHRQKFKTVGGQFPRWDGSNGIKSKNSFSRWTKQKFKDGHWYVQNNFTDPATGHSYVRNLVFGVPLSDTKHHWVAAINNGSDKNLAIYNGKVFSRQMPAGLEPWMKVKRKEMERNIKAAFRRGAHK